MVKTRSLQECLAGLAALEAQAQKAQNSSYIEKQHVNQVKHVLNNNLEKHVKHDPLPRGKNTSPIYDLIDRDLLFQRAMEWGVYRDTLYKYCKQLGSPSVRELIQYTARSHHISDRARYLVGILKNKARQAG